MKFYGNFSFNQLFFTYLLNSLITACLSWPHEANSHQLHHFHSSHHDNTHDNGSIDALSIASTTAFAKGVHHSDWHRMETMDGNGLYLLEWWTKAKDIYFRVTVNTKGFIGLGFSRKSGRMNGADMVLLWVDDRTGKANALVSESFVFLFL